MANGLGDGQRCRAPPALVDWEALTHFDGDMAGAQALVALAQHKAGAVEEDGEEGKPQALREVERPLVETQDFAVGGARAFGENQQTLPAFEHGVDFFQHFHAFVVGDVA